MSTYIVDALMLGRLPHSAGAIAASSLGNTIYYAIVFFAIYLLNGLETFISQAAGRGDRLECVRMLMQSGWIVALGTPAVMLLCWSFGRLLERFGVSPELAQQTRGYLNVLVWSTLPLMLYMAMRRFLQSVNHVGLISISLVTAGAVNLLFDWLLLFGHWGFPATGLRGSAWATVTVRCWMLLVLVPGLIIAFRNMNVRPGIDMLRADGRSLKALLQIGWPSGLEFSLELGISTFMSLLCARLGTTMLAAHQVTLDLNAFVYMVPTGLSYAAMIRVGQAAGRNELQGVRRANSVTLSVACGFSTIVALCFLGLAHPLAGLYTNDPAVSLAATPLLRLCGLLLLGDAVFVIHASAFTGLGDTRTPLWVCILCNWLIGMPAAYLLAFQLGFGVLGLWMGRAIASVSSGAAMMMLWRRRMSVADRCHSNLSLSPIDLSARTLEPST